MIIRSERPGDEIAIRAVTAQAFHGHPHSDGREPDIVDRLRRDGALLLSLVAEKDGEVVGHVAVSSVTVGNGASAWCGLGPLSVLPSQQGRGIGSALMQEGLARLEAAGAGGCVVLGDPAFYARFGFRAHPGLVLPGAPADHFMALAFDAPASGTVSYHAAFD